MGSRNIENLRAQALSQKPQRMRGIMVFVLVVIAALAVALAVSYAALQGKSQTAVWQQRNLAGPMMASSSSGKKADPFARGITQTEVPNLASLVGMTRDQALSAIGHGAAVADERPSDTVRGGARTVATVPLTAEKSDSQAGAPTVYLWLDEAQRVCGARYSVSMESLGYSNDLTFRQAIVLMHVLENTLAQAGVEVPEHAVQLPTDRSQYVTYREDGRTIAREYASFEGELSEATFPSTWFAALDYDYAEAIETGNLADAVHIVTVGTSLA